MNGTTTQIVKRINDKGEINLANLSQEEIEKYNRISSTLKSNDKNSIVTYGENIQNYMSKSSDAFLSQVKMSNVDSELSELIIKLEGELNSVDTSDFDKASFKNILRQIPIIKYIVGTVEKTMKKYDNVLANVENISNKIKASRITLTKDNQQLEVMLKENAKAIRALDDYIIAATLKCQEVSAKLEEMLANRDKYDDFDIQDMMYFKNNLENKINNMKLVRYTFKQTVMEIRIIQDTNMKTCEKTQEITSVTIGTWKQQIALAMAAKNSKTAAKNNKLVRETTNKLITENAKTIKETAILVEEESQKSAIDIAALEESTHTLVETFNEIKNLRANYRSASNDYDAKLKEFEDALRIAATDTPTAIEGGYEQTSIPQFVSADSLVEAFSESE